jgi:hypothetical protein
METCSLVNFRLGPNPTAMLSYDPVHHCQANASALEFVIGMQTLKHAEELICVAHIEACTIILY